MLCAVPGAGGVINCADQRQPAHLLVCPHVVIVQINAHSKLAVYFLKFNNCVCDTEVFALILNKSLYFTFLLLV